MVYKDMADLRRQLAQLKKENFLEISPEDATELKDIKIDKRLAPEQRMKSLLEQVGNPYVYRVGEMVVKVSFSGGGRTLQDCMEDYLKADMMFPR